MATAYTSLLGLALPVTGELSGTWGDTVNNSITSLLDSAIAGTTTLSSDADVTLTTTTGASNTSRQAILLWTAGGTVTRNITAPAQSKIYTVINASSSTQSIVLRGVGPTTGVTIVKGESAVCAWNGSDFIKISNTSGAGVFTTVTASSLTSGRVVYASTSGLLVDNSGFTYAGTNLALTTGDMTIGNGSSATTRMFRALEVGASGNTAGIAFGSGGVKGAVYGQSGSSNLSIVSGNSGAIAFGYATSSNDAGASANFNSLGAWTTTGLGIGTSSPTKKLDVYSTTQRGQIAMSGSNVVAIRWATTDPNPSERNWEISNNIDGQGALSFRTGATQTADPTTTRMVIDSSGNLGLGVTPSAWSSGKVLEVGNAGNSFWGNSPANVYITENAYYNGAWKYGVTAGAATYQLNQNSHIWSIAASGTAGNAITFTQAMTLDASGRLIVGATAVTGSNQVEIQTGLTNALWVQTGSTSSSNYIADFRTGANQSTLALRADNTALMSGNLLVGGPTAFLSGSTRLQVYHPTAPAAEFSIANGATTDVVGTWNKATTGDNQFVSFYTEASATRRGSITYNRAAGLVAYNTTSDYRAKDIVGSVTDSGALIDSVPVYMGTMKGATQERPMFIAHETPVYAHTGEKDAVDKDGNPVYQQMDASALIPVMWAEIQSLRKRLATLEAK